MSRAEWWITFVGLTVRDALLTVCGSLMALQYIPDRTVAVNVAILIPVASLALWTSRVISIARSRRGRRGGAR